MINVPKKNLELTLLGLRLGVAIVLLVWTLDKLINPGHTAVIFNVFYSIENMGFSIVYLLGALQAAIVFSFIIGFQKRWVTLLILLMHLGSTLSSFGRYIDPWSGSNLLFFAAWPMLAAIIALYCLRDFDTLFTVNKKAQE